MANLLYICPQNDIQEKPIFLELAEAMLSCSHKVRLLTTFSQENEDFEPPKKLEYMMPFKNWSVLELPKVVLSSQNFAPDVIHFFYDHGNRTSRRLLNMIMPSFFKTMFGSKLVFHILGPVPKPSFTFSQWIHQSDLVITADHFQLLKASSLLESPRGQMHMVMGEGNKSLRPTDDLSWIKERFSEFIYVGGSITSVSEAIEIFKTIEYEINGSNKKGVVLNVELLQGGILAEVELQAFLQDNRFENKTVLLRSINSQQNSELISHCSGFFINHLGLEPKSLSLAIDAYLHDQQTVYCSTQQAYFIKDSVRSPIFVRECILGRPIIEGFNSSYMVEPKLSLDDHVSMDQMNALNRAYAQLLV